MVAVGDKIRITVYQHAAPEGSIQVVSQVDPQGDPRYGWEDPEDGYDNDWVSTKGCYEVVTAEAVNHPAHYNQYNGFEVFDIVEQLNFNKGSAVKYVLRAEYKGKEVEDLKKAIACLEREVKRVEDQGTTP